MMHTLLNVFVLFKSFLAPVVLTKAANVFMLNLENALPPFLVFFFNPLLFHPTDSSKGIRMHRYVK